MTVSVISVNYRLNVIFIFNKTSDKTSATTLYYGQTDIYTKYKYSNIYIIIIELVLR